MHGFLGGARPPIKSFLRLFQTEVRYSFVFEGLVLRSLFLLIECKLVIRLEENQECFAITGDEATASFGGGCIALAT